MTLPRFGATILSVAIALSQSLGAQGIEQLEPVGAFLNGALPVGTPNSADYTYVDAFPGLVFDDPLTFTPEPGTDRIWIGSRDGVIQIVDNASTSPSLLPFHTLNDCAVVWDGGLLGLAFHPEWGSGTANANYFYVYYCSVAPGLSYPNTFGTSGGFFNAYLRLTRFTRDPATDVVVPGSEQNLLKVRLYNESHRGGGLLFGDDGFLYLSIGDQFNYTTAQDISTNFEGGILRLDVDMQGGSVSHPPTYVGGLATTGFVDDETGSGYFIPSDNPFVGVSGVFEEFWTLGNRAPHRVTKDMQTGLMWTAEIGHQQREEINILEGGKNYQWPFREGFVDNSASYPRPATVLGIEQLPLVDFPRAQARAIIGGYVYRGSLMPELQGVYICGDYRYRNLFAVTPNGSFTDAVVDEIGYFTPGDLATFGQDLAGEVYLCGLGDDVPVYRLAPPVNPYPEAPASLANTGVFTDLATLAVHDYMIPYDVQTALWSDGAAKRRWLAVPNDGVADTVEEQIVYDEHGPWEFPVGTVLVKHFETPSGRRLETRLFVHGEDAWYGITYKWNAAGTDALLLTSSAVETVDIEGESVEYHYPSRTECRVCHNPDAGYVNGLRSRQLNGMFDYPLSGNSDNQIQALDYVGLLHPAPDLTVQDRMITNVAIDDSDASLEQRVRSYLDANCAQCHRPENVHNAIDARSVRALPFQGLLDAPVGDDLGIVDARVVAPGEVQRSVLYYRMNQTGGCCGAMPPLGRGRVDARAVALVHAWIQSLPPAVVVGSAEQSSTALNTIAAERAVDGSINGFVVSRSVSLTNNEWQPFWQADLGTEFVLDGVRIWNRSSPNHSHRLADFSLFLATSPFPSADYATVQGAAGVTEIFHLGIAARQTYYSLAGVAAQHVRVQLSAQNSLGLAEVQLYGRTTAAGVIAESAAITSVSSMADDAEEQLTSNSVLLHTSDLELGRDGNIPQVVGMRFPLAVPPGASIVSATVQFRVDEVSTGAAALEIGLQDVDDAEPITNGTGDLSLRTRLLETVGWGPPEWLSTQVSSEAQRTPNLRSLLQQIVDRPGWQDGNHVLVLVQGTGTRTAEAYEGSQSYPPELRVEFVAANTPPVVDAGPSTTVPTGQAFTLAGSVEDNQPAPSVLWELLSGPALVVPDPTNPNGVLTFAQPGDYVLRLTADDGEFTRSDVVTIAAVNGPQTLVQRINAGTNDAEERRNGGSLTRTSVDLDLGRDRNRHRVVGLRFPVDIPAGATILDASIAFTAAAVKTNATTLLVRAANEDDALYIQSGPGLSLASRDVTSAGVTWNVPPWASIGSSGANETTPNLAAIVQELVDRPAWSRGNRMLFLLRSASQGKRVAASYDYGPAFAPALTITWQ